MLEMHLKNECNNICHMLIFFNSKILIFKHFLNCFEEHQILLITHKCTSHRSYLPQFYWSHRIASLFNKIVGTNHVLLAVQ